MPKCLMEFCKVTLAFELADEIVWCDHSNESSLPVLTHGAIYFSKFCKMKFGNLVEICFWLHLAVKGLIIYHVKVLLTKFDLSGTWYHRISSTNSNFRTTDKINSIMWSRPDEEVFATQLWDFIHLLKHVILNLVDHSILIKDFINSLRTEY